MVLLSGTLLYSMPFERISMISQNSLVRDVCLRFYFLLGLGVAGMVGGPSVAAADVARRAPVGVVLRHTLPAGEGVPILPAGLTLADWSQIRGEYERHRHGVFADGQGGYQARSHYHGWLARFDGKGFLVDPDGEGWQWGLELVRWGRAGSEVEVSGAAGQAAKANRLEYRRAGLTEWFENGKEGLEHGFTVTRRPAGQGDELALEMRVRGGLEVVAGEDGATGLAYRRKGGGTVVRYRKLWVTDARGRRLGARLEAGEGLVRIVVRDREAAYPITVDPIVQQAYLKAATQASRAFGGTMAISGDTLVVGAPNDDSGAIGVNGNPSDNSAPFAGAVYVFVRGAGGWSQQAYLKASNTDARDSFGYALGISGNTIVVSTAWEDSSATGVNGNESDNSALSAGAAYVFVRRGGSWSQQAYLKASNAEAGDRFGSAVSISGDTIIVGAQGEDSNATGINGNQSDNSVGVTNQTTAGAAYIFSRSGGAWTQQAYVKASNTDPEWGDNFGIAVAISGNTAVVGAQCESSNATGVNGNQNVNVNATWCSGAAYVFVRNGETWSQQAYMKASNPGFNDNFGIGLAISGDTIVVGANWEDSNASGVNGNQANNQLSNSGAAYVFVRTGNTWSQQAYLKASNPGASDEFGSVLALDGETLVVGCPFEDSSASGVDGNQSDNSASNAGAAYVFVRSGGTWTQRAYLKASNTEALDSFGAVALAGDTLVVGACCEDSSATGVNGDQFDNLVQTSGAAYVFRVTPNSVAPATSVAPSAGATGQSFLVNAEAWLPWTATSDAPWVTITSGATGVGNGTVVYTVAPNLTLAVRTGTVTVGGLTHTLRQEPWVIRRK